jgi:hypothetical protein
MIFEFCTHLHDISPAHLDPLLIPTFKCYEHAMASSSPSDNIALKRAQRNEYGKQEKKGAMQMICGHAGPGTG